MVRNYHYSVLPTNEMFEVQEKDTPLRLSSSHVLVILASSLGTLFEWYDFSLMYGVAANMAEHFFSPLPSGKAFLLALFTFSAGVTLRPLGSLIFGHFGDKVGRKYAFLVTICMMGGSTFLVGLLPTYAMIGIWAPILLFLLRVVQGLAVGGEYGGAATYLAEHAPYGKRGFYTGFLQATGSAGWLSCLTVVILCQEVLGMKAFNSWGWRVPFLLSLPLLSFSIFIRTKLEESPVFLKMKMEGEHAKAPLKEAFCDPENLKTIVIALFGVVIGQAVVGGGGGYSYYFLSQILKIDQLTVNYICMVAMIFAIFFNIFFGWLSDQVGRKPIILSGVIIGILCLFPIFGAYTHYGNPELEEAMHKYPAVVISDPKECTFQLIPSELKEHIKLTSSCDILKNVLYEYGVSYTNEEAPRGAIATLKIGNIIFHGVDISNMNETSAKISQKKFSKNIEHVLQRFGYPPKANPAKINWSMLILLYIFVNIIMTLSYGPLAAFMVESFPTKIRYTSLSITYHIAHGWFSNFVGTIAFAIVIATGNIYSGLLYPICLASFCFVIGVVYVKETKDTMI